MAILQIRKIEPEVIRIRENSAQRNGRSLDDEVCEILRIALDREDEENAKRANR